jgi:hypothetical protein
MRTIMIAAALAGLGLAASPALAARNLECMNSGYSEEQEQIFADYLENFTVASLDEEEDEDTPDPLVDPVSDRAVQCTLEHGWSPDAIYYAITYRLAVLLERALELKTPLSEEEMARMNKAIANADQDRLRAILGPDIEASLNNEDGPEMSEQDELYLGLLVLGSGLPMEESYSNYIGLVLGARMMIDITSEKFAES